MPNDPQAQNNPFAMPQGARKSSLDAPVTSLSRVGPKLAQKLARLGLNKVSDLLFHLPLRYEDRTQLTAIGALSPDARATICGHIQLAEIITARRRSLLVRVSDDTGHIDLCFFHFSNAQKDGLKSGVRIFCHGATRRGRYGLEIIHPEYQLLGPREAVPLETHLNPVYPTTEGLSQPVLRRLCAQALRHANAGQLDDWLGGTATALALPSLLEALHLAHEPTPTQDTHALLAGTHRAIKRLALEELVAHHLSHQAIRTSLDARQAPVLPVSNTLTERLTEAFTFPLTGAQSRVAAEIADDLSRPRPMYRLVQGDVGSGKTVVAALAIAQAVAEGHQAAVMAPTELLAEQHWRNLFAWFDPLNIRVVPLGGRQGAKQKRDVLAALASGEAGVAVGTHALFQDNVQFCSLALAVIDEQHRFGVHQRLALLSKSGGESDSPHQLIMTATPIPRTLAMTACAHLDVSSIDELPPGRQPVDTAVVPDRRRDVLVQRVAKACADGQQAYWVCPLVDESEALEAQAAEDTANALAEALPDLRIGLVHGRIKSAERDAIMSTFRDGGLDLLVATTVIEVGVDVPNAALMIIENAERMGLAQLHQLRGRVGRGVRKSHCVLLYHPPLSRQARARLQVMRETNDGFAIAAKDLQLRGPGEVLGTRQTGEVSLRIADLARDEDLVEDALSIADTLAPDAATALIQRWVGTAIGYGEVG